MERKIVEIKPGDIEKFMAAAKSLDQLMRKIQVYAPEANLYAEDSNTLNLMKGPTHDDSMNQRPMQESIVLSATVVGLSGGGW